MKLVTAVIQPHRLYHVTEALEEAGVHGVTIVEAHGAGRQQGHTEVYRGAEYHVDLIPKLRLEVVCADEDSSGVVEAISSGARTGEIGDGKIWVVPVAEVVRVRTGESGEAAL
ncbi:P-II family nitrogen regulator [Actinomyces viscosus]|uniref:Nitrogen regulatory protein P-II n=1 Tax=Actinomyces viscosus TaxID=1656 RepID=A0A448PJZ7_ACTVI|nr:P-II family nitrogen regulator [Actinomyces viscosus]TFH54185.1 P-II family nitrogen regulator [Actinomyces viscosus]VEI15481.1 Nitrogen regulatory protein P-II [Actinomyces viscosus]